MRSSLVARFTSVLLLLALTIPVLLVRSPKVAASGGDIAAAPTSVPPEPFSIHSPLQPSYRAKALVATLSFAASAVKMLNGPEIPAGLENAKVSTRLESAYDKLSGSLGLAKASASAPAATPPPQPSSVVDFDFDNDGKADIGRWHSANAELKVKNSNGGSYSDFTVGCAPPTTGCSQPKVAPGDFNGDGKTDAAVFNAGTWTYKTSVGATAQTISWGTSGDIPVAGDYDGDGTTDAAIYRPSTSTWWIRKSSGGTVSAAFGSSGDIAVPGDYDGDGKNDFALYRPSGGDWHITGSTVGYYVFHWGVASDTPVAADYDGDGKTDPAVFRTSTGVWYAYRSGLSNGSFYTQTWGNYRDQPVPADYDGDNKADYAVWRPTTGVWYIMRSSDAGYEYHTLGVPGDTAVPSAYLKQVGGEVTGDAIATARLSPKNETGGINLYSQNFSWGTSLASLPGRSGLNADIGISYNSLVWTKVGNAMVFDSDYSNASPGFRLGFAEIEPIYYDDAKGVWAYMMVTPSGSRVQFRQTTVSNVYETADSSYTQLVVNGAASPNDPVENLTIKVTTTDGTQMTYAWILGAYRCTEIKDRNGNKITIGYDYNGSLQTITDTLGRILTVYRDTTTGYPSSIKQNWGGGVNGEGTPIEHTWATFAYTTTNPVDTDFHTSLAVVGPPDGMNHPVLDKITYPDGSSTKFEYNGYLQVKKVSNIAADSTTHILNSTETNLASPGTSLTDCPRFTQTSTVTENFNGGNPVTVTNSTPTAASFSLQGGTLTGSGARIDVSLTGHPDGLYSRTYVGSSGWKEGLTLATEDCVGTNCSDLKRWTWTDWAQDNSHPTDPSTLPYILNPRVVESRVGDGTNTKRSKIEHLVNTGTNVAVYGLVKSAFVYDTDLSTVLKKTDTTYNLDPAYTSRRIIGLPSLSEAYGLETTGLNLMSKVTYAYDEGNFSDSNLGQNISPVQYDSTNYGASFIAGRGNLTSTTRWNVEYPTNSSYAISSSTKYNTAGSPVAQITPWDGTNTRTTRIGYADNFNSTVSVSTYAYPTVITNPAGTSLGDANYSSTIQYRYDMGANVEANSPAPAGNSTGKRTRRTFDAEGRLSKDAIWKHNGTAWVEHAYTRYEYPNTGIQSKVYSTAIDINSSGGPDPADEVLTESFVDGAGRVRRSRAPHTFNPNGTTATWAGTINEYDVLGRVKRQSVPTEVDDDFNPTGDDATRGSLWTYQKYDWMNRVVRKINTDGLDQTAHNESDILISYTGCGCAGATTTTVEAERVPIPGTSNFGRRKQKAYTDILGRDFKTETFEWDGTAVYSSIVHTYNGRDQITNTRQFGDATYRDVTMSFDGHGRMKTRRYPIEDSGANTIWVYNPDDSIQTVTDPRGVVTSFAYNSRGLTTAISYDPGSTGVADTADVGFAYDNAANRTSMTDGTGNTSYVYNSLSQITSETKYVTELNQNFPINYTYNLSGAIQTYTDPQSTGVKAEYTFDKAGRITATRNTSSGIDKQKIHETQYRAWGAVKKHTFVSIGTVSLTSHPVEFNYDNRLQVSGYAALYPPNANGVTFAVNYTRNADGKVSLSTDTVLPSFTRNFEYDHVGRVTKSLSGNAVHGMGTETPYRTAIAYNSFSEASSTSGKHWEVNNSAYTLSITAATGRDSNAQYDAAGNITHERMRTAPIILNRVYGHDAAGRNISVFDPALRTSETDKNNVKTFDGNGWLVKQEKTQGSSWTKRFEISSTVLDGETVAVFEFDNFEPTPDIKQFLSYVNGVKLTFTPPDTYGGYSWLSPEGTTMHYGGSYASEEFDPRGGAVGIENPYSSGGGYGGGGGFGDAQYYSRCDWEGFSIPCSMKGRLDRLQTIQDTKWGEHKDKKRKEKEKKSGVPETRSKLDTAAARMSMRSLKPGVDPEKGETVHPGLVPDASGQNDDGCVYGTDGGPNSCTVQSMKWNFDDVDAGVGFAGNDGTACYRMTRVLSGVVNIAIANFGGAVAASPDSHAEIDGIVDNVDKAFSGTYSGRQLKTIADARALSPSGVGPHLAPPPYGGQSGFKADFREGDNMENDQTHHFATYFSGGINAMSLTTSIHELFDDSEADVRLGKAAYSLGQTLRVRMNTVTDRNNPRFPITTRVPEKPLDRLRRVRNIADRVQELICE